MSSLLWLGRQQSSRVARHFSTRTPLQSTMRCLGVLRPHSTQRRASILVTTTGSTMSHQSFPTKTLIGSLVVSRRLLHSSPTLLNDSFPPHTIVPLPALSPTMDVGSIQEWNLSEGNSFAAGDVLCTVQTDKASVDFESQEDGILAKILVFESDEEIPVGTPICITVEEADDVAAFENYQVEGPDAGAAHAAATSSSPPPAGDEATVAAAKSSTSFSPAPSLLMPSARHLSESKGVDASVLSGTGKGGRVTKADFLQALASGMELPPLSRKETATTAAATQQQSSTAGSATASMPPPTIASETIDSTGTFEDVPNNKMRKIIASRLTESKRDVPHFYTSMEVELDNVLSLRKKLAANHDVKVSVNDFIIRCSALALRDVPEVNGTYDAATDTVKLQESIDVSVAVATPTGLITPIVFNTDKQGLSDITATVRDLAGRAREGKLAPHEYQGGTFSISNLGMFGIDEFSAVINPPQAAILAVGGGSRRVVPAAYVDGADEQAKPSIKTIMTARLSADRRVVDEATASLFMSAFRHYINDPELLLL